MVVGHYGCGGIGAVLEETLPFATRHDRLCELNAIEQAMNVRGPLAVGGRLATGQRRNIFARRLPPRRRLIAGQVFRCTHVPTRGYCSMRIGHGSSFVRGAGAAGLPADGASYGSGRQNPWVTPT